MIESRRIWRRLRLHGGADGRPGAYDESHVKANTASNSAQPAGRVPATGRAGSQPSALNLLDVDPELAADLEPDRRAAARVDLRAYVMALPRGRWTQPRWPTNLTLGAGLLLIDGMLLRRVSVGGRAGAELLGAGDVVRPWQHEGTFASMARTSEWMVLERTHVALLDVDVVTRLGPYPEITGRLFGRVLQRSRRFAVNIAIVHQPKVETRVHMLMWHLADRWGRVQPAGVLLPLRLTHAMLADLVAARRPTVSAALSALEREGLLEKCQDGWLLHGSPPGDMLEAAAAQSA
jgi:CRP-like cAMP-binding protein